MANGHFIARRSLPVNITPPIISGIPYKNQVLTCSNGAWLNFPTVFEYRWTSAGIAIINPYYEYTVQLSDDGDNLKCQVRAKNSGGWSDWVDSNTLIGLSPLAWYDASDPYSILDISGNVYQWNDKSGNGYHATQTTPNYRPKTETRIINGLNALEFITGNSFLSLPSGLMTSVGGSNNSTVIGIAAKDDVGRSDAIVADQGRYRLILSSTGAYWRMGATTGTQATIARTANTTQHIVIGQRNGTANRCWLDGGPPALNNTQTDVTLSQLRIAHNDIDFDGPIGEIAFFNRALNVNEINQVGNMSYNKWATPWSLAS